MTKLPRVTGKEAIAARHKAGFDVVRVRGSHHFMRHEDGRNCCRGAHGRNDWPRPSFQDPPRLRDHAGRVSVTAMSLQRHPMRRLAKPLKCGGSCSRFVRAALHTGLFEQRDPLWGEEGFGKKCRANLLASRAGNGSLDGQSIRRGVGEIGGCPKWRFL